MHPRIEDDLLATDGPTLRVRRAIYDNGRIETWIEAPTMESRLGRRLSPADDGRPGRLLPDGIEASVLYENGLWGGIDATDLVLELGVDALHGVRDGDDELLPFDLPAHQDFEIVSSICRYFGVLPDFDARGMRIPDDIDEARMIAARSERAGRDPDCYSMLPPSAGRG